MGRDFFFLAALLLIGAASAAFSLWCVGVFRKQRDDVTQVMPVGPFFVSVSALYSLLLAFQAGSIWAKEDRAETALLQARTSLERLVQFSKSELLDDPSLAVSVSRYARAVIDHEWGEEHNRVSDPRVEEALQALRVSVVRASRSASPALQGHLLHLLDDAVKARSVRLWIGMQKPDWIAWGVIGLLGVLSQIAIALVHLDRPRAAVRAVAVFSTACALVYWLLLRSENPYEALRASLNPGLLF